MFLKNVKCDKFVKGLKYSKKLSNVCRMFESFSSISNCYMTGFGNGLGKALTLALALAVSSATGLAMPFAALWQWPCKLFGNGVGHPAANFFRNDSRHGFGIRPWL